jgi:hypothetical protein
VARLDLYNEKVAELIALAAGAEDEALEDMINGVLEGFPAIDKDRVAELSLEHAERHREKLGFQAILRRGESAGPALEVVR